jgi:hypothetical protein
MTVLQMQEAIIAYCEIEVIVSLLGRIRVKKMR